jgi:hypothetical protein
MLPPSSSLEEQVRALSDRVASLEARFAAIESRPAAEPASGAPEVSGIAALPDPLPEAVFDPLYIVAALGRALIILGGAFLLRALTEGSIWPPGVGVSLGLLYALTWIATSTFAAIREDRLRAIFDGGTGLAIGFPLIAEATLKFGLFTPMMAAFALGAFAACVLLSASYGHLLSLAWLASLGGLGTGLTLMASTGVVAPFSFYFTSLGVGTLWLGYVRHWRGLRWPTGAVASFAVLGVTLRAVAEPPVDSAALAWASQGFMLVAYLGSIAIRTLVRGRQVIVFEIAQTVLALLVGLGGMIAVGRSVGAGGLLLGGVITALGVAAYAVAFQFLARHAPGAQNFYFYSSLALLFVMVGNWTALEGAPRAMALTAIGVALAAAWSRSSRSTLGAHAAIALLAASEAGGLATVALAGFVGELPPANLSLWPALVTLAAVLALSASRLTAGRGAALSAAEAPGLLLALVAAVGLAGLATMAVTAALEQAMSPAASRALLDTIRTAVLSMVVVGCARLPRSGRFSAWGRLAYPLLAATGVKLLVIDLRSSQASTLFAALACYGAALVLVPRLRRLAEGIASSGP